MLRHLAITVAFLHIFAGIGAAQTPDPGAIHIGDRWTYDVSDGLTGDLKGTVTIVAVEINNKEILTQVLYKGKSNTQVQVFDTDWGRIDDGIWKHQPSGIGIKKQLQIGKEWRSDANAQDLRNGNVFRASQAAKVVGQEQVATRAGAFDTFKIETTVRLVNSRDETKSMTETSEIWYAPAINRWVKKTIKLSAEGRVRNATSEELTEYLRKP